MDRLRSSTKRAHSATPPPDASSVPQVNGACVGKPVDAEDAAPPAKTVKAIETPDDESEVLEMPAFLQLEDAETREKYDELVRLENERLARGNDDPDWGHLDPDPVLDRYNNIHPWANNRIKLRVPEGVNDYINASPVALLSTSSKQSTVKKGIQNKYICMQGPKKETVGHVWHMLWHELSTPYKSSPAIIIMLSPTHGPNPADPTKLMEKCFPYFPVDENVEFNINETNELGEEFKGKISFVSREPGIPGTSIEVRRFQMTVEGEDEEKPIWHYLYPNWPDFGALEDENVASILALMEISRKANGGGENPRLVHCSAGVGRTGTFVALEFLVSELHGGSWEGWEKEHAGQDPVFEAVNQLREQRRTMVQAYEQYAFIYEVLRKLWEEKYATPCQTR
ncbi:protein-tyrosine phosphatase-like protein [Amylocarpus encephaloides]|uniref:Protein-tyrosine phosphatase-like protein n=1 Tax=Amylocarpus encephaloides TaxID=45428 RepID=A0A9P7YE54_9HELO|nr:protein-tyrosine phosphatase-like protein [Amylocarpus encephaloides]